MEEIAIQTGEGTCPTYVFTPAGSGPWPAAIFYMDGLGVRPTLFAMAQRLADAGYVVLLPDLYYRMGPYEPFVPADVFAGGNPLSVIGAHFSSTSTRLAGVDTAAYLAYLDTRGDVVPGKVGLTGYCMGGGMAITAAGLHPDRIAAAASYHGGNLATDSDISPHLLAPAIKGRIYVAGAVEDGSYPPEMAERLEQALSDAGVDHLCETYEGALHGWTMADFPVYNEAAAERHWRSLLGLFEEALA